MLKRYGKYQFYKMEIGADIIFHAAKILVKNDFINASEYNEKFFKSLGKQLNQNNYPVGSINFLSYYGIVKKIDKKIYVENRNLLIFAAESIEKSAALLLYLLKFEFDNSPECIQNSINRITAILKNGGCISNSDILNSYKLWFDTQENKNLKKENTKDTSRKFTALLFTNLFLNNVSSGIPWTKLYSVYRNITLKGNIKLQDDLFQFKDDYNSYYNVFIKYYKSNAKKRENHSLLSFDINKVRDFFLDIDELGDPKKVYGESKKEGYKRNPEVKKEAFKKFGRICFSNNNHESFIKSTGEIYMESHHGIEIQYAKRFNLTEEEVDIIDNIFPLCATCHKMIHFAEPKYKKDLVKRMYDKVVSRKIILDSEDTKIEFMSQYNISKII